MKLIQEQKNVGRPHLSSPPTYSPYLPTCYDLKLYSNSLIPNATMMISECNSIIHHSFHIMYWKVHPSRKLKTMLIFLWLSTGLEVPQNQRGLLQKQIKVGAKQNEFSINFKLTKLIFKILSFCPIVPVPFTVAHEGFLHCLALSSFVIFVSIWEWGGGSLLFKSA